MHSTQLPLYIQASSSVHLFWVEGYRELVAGTSTSASFSYLFGCLSSSSVCEFCQLYPVSVCPSICQSTGAIIIATLLI